jgi:hypothetical protein
MKRFKKWICKHFGHNFKVHQWNHRYLTRYGQIGEKIYYRDVCERCGYFENIN